MLGAAAATGTPRYSSIRCFAKVAACAELPRAQVTTTEGGQITQPRGQLRDRPGEPLGLIAHRVGRLAQLAPPCPSRKVLFVRDCNATAA